MPTGTGGKENRAPGALTLLGYRGDVAVNAVLDLGAERFAIGERLSVTCQLSR